MSMASCSAVDAAELLWRRSVAVTLAATVVFCYSCLVPIALWAVFWWRGVQTSVTLLQLNHTPNFRLRAP